jgi:hypothetical protein
MFIMPMLLIAHTLLFAAKMGEMAAVAVAMGKTSMVPYTVIGC